MSQPNAKVDAAVLAICEQGCRWVNQAIERLGNGQTTEETMALTLTERRAVLIELEEVMSVYDAPCDLPEPSALQQA